MRNTANWCAIVSYPDYCRGFRHLIDNLSSMLTRRLLLKFMVLLPLAAAAKPTAAPLQTLDGVLVKLQEGDFYHISVRDKNGKERSFFVANDKSFKPLLEAPDKFKGRKVRVRWHKVSRVLEPAGPKPITFEEAASIEFL